MKRSSLTKKSVALFGFMLFTGTCAHAGVITDWNMNNVTVTPGPYALYETYNSYLFTDATKQATNGAIIWKETNTLAPGMKIVNSDDQTGEKCIMSYGFNPVDGTDKMCSDPFQTSKRWKLKHVEQAPLDVYFNVTSGSTSVYRSMQKLTNATATRLQGFTMELGFMVNGQFVKSKAGDGLGFSNDKGTVFAKPTPYNPAKDKILSAFFPHEMAGAPDAHHPEPGYFYPTERMLMDLVATEDAIVSTGISSNHLDLLGYWHTADAVPTGIRFDDDWDVNTDNILVANCEGEFDDATQQCQGTWVTYRSCIGLGADGMPCDSDGIRKVIPQTTIDAWLADPQFLLDLIDDLGNATLNYYIAVGDNSKWPTPNQFVARFTPIPVGADPVTPPPVSNDVDVAIDAVTIPGIKVGATGTIAVNLKNLLPGAASGTLELVVTDATGKVLDTYSTSFTTTKISKANGYKFPWTAPSYKTTVTATATVKDVAGDGNPDNNTLSTSRAIR